MASKLLIYLLPVIICIIVLYLPTGVDGQNVQEERQKVFLFDRNNKNLERRRNNQRRTEEERALRRQQVQISLEHSSVHLLVNKKYNKIDVLLDILGVCDFIISKWAPLSHGLLWFLVNRV